MKKKIYSSNKEQLSIFYYYWIVIRLNFKKFMHKKNPHKSFRLTRRRDYKRQLILPGYFKFTKSVFALISKNKKIFIALIAFIMMLSILLVGFMDQSFLATLQDTLSEVDSGDELYSSLGEIGRAGVLVLSTASSGGLVYSPTESQQIILVFITIFSWLAIVWLVRNIMAERKDIKLRDALYNCGSPIIALAAVVLIIIAQLIPALIAIVVYNAAVSTGFLSGGVESMAVATAVLLMVSLSVYWIIGSFFALIISTLPGMYPLKAVNIAREMVIGRRVKIFMRILWAVLICVLMWVPIVILVALTDWLGGKFEIINDIPIVQFFMLLTNCLILVFLSSYTYMLYRGVVDNDSRA